MLENCFSKAESRKQILEIWQKLSERDVAFCYPLGKITVQNRPLKRQNLLYNILRTAVAMSNTA